MIDITGWVMSEHGVPTSKLTVIKRVEGSKKPILWECECSCESHNHIIASSNDIRKANIISCGCVKKPGLMVTCAACGEKIDRNTAFKITNDKGVNTYYCSQSEFEAEEERKRQAATNKNRVYRLICDITGEKEIINTALWKEWQIWNKVADNKKIGDYLSENKEYLISVISRIDQTEFAKIRYLSAIIKNKIKEFQSNQKEEQYEKVIDIGGVGPVNYKPKETRRGLDFLEDE